MALIKTVLDIETAYGKHPETGFNYTLSRMTTEEYIRHPLFKLHGIGVKIENERTFYVYGEDAVRFLKTHPWGRTYAIYHHAHFDQAALTWRAGIRPAMIGCTLSMARAVLPYEGSRLADLAPALGVGEKGTELMSVAGKWHLTDAEQAVLGGYCINDVDLTAGIFDGLKGHFPVDELRLIDLTVRFFSEPVVRINRQVVLEEYIRERKLKRALLKRCGADKSVLASNEQFAALLLTVGVDPPKKVSPAKVKDGRVDPDTVGEPPRGLLPVLKVQKGMSEEDRAKLKEYKRTYPWAYAFGKSDEEFRMLEQHPNEQVQALVEARMGVKSTIKETRSKRFYKIGTRGAFPVYLAYCGAKRTHRWGGGDKTNCQNLTRVNPKDPKSGALRRSWTAPDGHMLVVRDLGQIECRKLAYYAGQDDLVGLFRAGGDPYNHQATKIFGYEVNRKLDEFFIEGLAGKASTLGNGYGMGWSKFQESLRVGFMGMPSLLFGPEEAAKLGADIDVFCMQKSYKKGFSYLREEALAMKPLNVSEEAHLWHCASVKQIVDVYRSSNPAIKASWREAGFALDEIIAGRRVQLGQRCGVYTCPEGILLPNGMKLRYHKLRKTKSGDYRYLSDKRRKEWTYIYGGKVVENIIQALSRILIAAHKLKIAARLRAQQQRDPRHLYKVVTSTHDEVVCCVPTHWAQKCLDMMGEVMAVPEPWCADLPLKSSGGFAKNYGDCEK